MELAGSGGHLLIETPGNNWFGHGFYQFSPELFFSLLDKKNGFSNTRIFMQSDTLAWYEAITPASLGRRTGVCCAVSRAMLMHIISRKTAPVPAEISVYQSDYVCAWDNNDPVDKKATLESKSWRALYKIRRCIPRFLLPTAYWLWNWISCSIQIGKSYIRAKYFENPNWGGGGG
jgi:hypothetical protein